MRFKALLFGLKRSVNPNNRAWQDCFRCRWSVSKRTVRPDRGLVRRKLALTTKHHSKLSVSLWWCMSDFHYLFPMLKIYLFLSLTLWPPLAMEKN